MSADGCRGTLRALASAAAAGALLAIGGCEISISPVGAELVVVKGGVVTPLFASADGTAALRHRNEQIAALGLAEPRLVVDIAGRSLLLFDEGEASAGASCWLWPAWQAADVHVLEGTRGEFIGAGHCRIESAAASYVIAVSDPGRRHPVDEGVGRLRIANDGTWAATTSDRALIVGSLASDPSIGLASGRVLRESVDQLHLPEGGGFVLVDSRATPGTPRILEVLDLSTGRVTWREDGAIIWPVVHQGGVVLATGEGWGLYAIVAPGLLMREAQPEQPEQPRNPVELDWSAAVWSGIEWPPLSLVLFRPDGGGPARSLFDAPLAYVAVLEQKASDRAEPE